MTPTLICWSTFISFFDVGLPIIFFFSYFYFQQNYVLYSSTYNSAYWSTIRAESTMCFAFKFWREIQGSCMKQKPLHFRKNITSYVQPRTQSADAASLYVPVRSLIIHLSLLSIRCLWHGIVLLKQAEHERLIKKRENLDAPLTWDEYKSMTFTNQVGSTAHFPLH